MFARKLTQLYFCLLQVNLVNFTSAEEIITLPKINEADLDTLSSANIELPAKDLCEQFSRESVTVIVYKDDSLLPNANGSSHPVSLMQPN